MTEIDHTPKGNNNKFLPLISEITYPMADKMKHDFYVPVVRYVALYNMPLRNDPSSQNFEGPMFICFL